MSQTGKISWFGGPQDPTSGPTTASGAPVTNPGIAVYNQATLGGWWLIKMPNGLLTFIKQTDIGPAPSTGRTFDFTYSALQSLGYSTSNFPTDSSVSGVYLGKTDVQVATNIVNAADSLGADTPNVAGWLQTVAKGMTFGVTPASGSAAGPLDTGSLDTGNKANQPQGPTNVISSSSDFFSMITNVQFWIRLAEGIAGAVLIGLGLHALMGGTATPITIAKSAVGK